MLTKYLIVFFVAMVPLIELRGATTGACDLFLCKKSADLGSR